LAAKENEDNILELFIRQSLLSPALALRTMFGKTNQAKNDSEEIAVHGNDRVAEKKD